MDVQLPTFRLLPPPYSGNEITSEYLSGFNSNSNSVTTAASTTLPETAEIVSRLNPNTTINVSNSSDICIGPMTQFNDRVTIYQYMDATRRNNIQTEQIESRASQQKSDLEPCTINLRKHWLNILAVCAIALGLSTTIYFIIFANNTDIHPEPIVFGRNYDSDTFPSIGGHYVLDREKWGAINTKSMQNMTKLMHPVKYVVIGHMGVQTEPCFNIYTCSVKMRAVQDNAIGNKMLVDLSGNFYLGGDGNIYMGRGWDFENAYGDKSLAIIFIGDFMRYEPEEKQINALEHLLTYGLVSDYLSKDFKIFGLNQTKLSKYSPGINVMKRIRRMPRFTACGEKGFSACGEDVNIKWNSRT